MRTKKAVYNIIASFLLQLTAVICGLIIPRLIIETYGSDVYGLTASITKFLGYIVLLEAGVGGVIKASLYKPLANKDDKALGKIIKATENFFKIVAFIFIVYLIVVALFFPLIVKNDFEHFFTFSLVIIIGTSIFFQYYFGISYQILLNADQKRYVESFLQIVSLIINAVIVIVLVKAGFGIHIVKIGSALVFLLRPLFLNVYVKRKYNINKKSDPDKSAIKQKWDGFGHHIAFLLHNNTDIVLLTIFANVREVAVYSVYYIVVSSVQRLVSTFSTGLEAAFGNMIAKDEKQALEKNFNIFELASFSITTVFFTTTALLIVPFVSIYTKGVSDVNYIRPIFAYILVAAEAVYCLRIPYHAVVLAAGHFKQTRNGAFAEAFINIAVSIVLVNVWGIVGVALGTLFAMVFRTVQYAIYLSKNVLKRSPWMFLKKLIIFGSFSGAIIITYFQFSESNPSNYFDFIVYSNVIFITCTIMIFLLSTVFYKNEVFEVLKIGKRILFKK